MRIPTLAVCTLATIAAQNFAQSAHSLPEPESMPESAPEVNPRVVPKSPIAASLSKMAMPEPIATDQIEFSRPATSFQSAPLETASQPQASPAIAQTTTIDDLETPLEPEPEPQPQPEPQLEPEPQPEPEPQAPVRPSETPSPPESGQYLQEEPLSPSSPPPSPPSPSSPSTPPPVSPSTSSPPSPGLLTEPIAPTVQIGNVTLPHRGALPSDFAFPIRIRVTVDRSITTNTPITDSTENLATWAERVRACLDEKPQLFAVRTDDTLAPILFDGQQGRILRNANRRMVCANVS